MQLLTLKTCIIAAISHTFARAERLKSRKIIQTLFREGKAFSVFPYRVYYKQADLSGAPYPAQVGFAVSSRLFSRAADRNRIKRLGREAWRRQKQVLYQFLKEKDLGLQLFLVFTGREIPAYRLVNDKVSVILKKLEKELTDRSEN